MTILENKLAPNYKHGMSVKGNVTPTYNSWAQMMSRCYDPNSTRFNKYGAKGIKVDSHWFTFTNFLLDMGERPENMTLDRKDNSKGYSKNNCKWSTKKEQANNRSNNRYKTFAGMTLTIMQWADLLGMTNRKQFHNAVSRGRSIVSASVRIISKEKIKRLRQETKNEEASNVSS